KIAIPVGDPAGIGPEIALKAALDPAVRAACDPMLVCDPALLERHAKACGIKVDFSQISLLACPQPETASLGFGVVSPVSGRASIAFCAAAVKAAMAGEVDAVVAARSTRPRSRRRESSSTAIRRSSRGRPAPTRTASI